MSERMLDYQAPDEIMIRVTRGGRTFRGFPVDLDWVGYDELAAEPTGALLIRGFRWRPTRWRACDETRRWINLERNAEA